MVCGGAGVQRLSAAIAIRRAESHELDAVARLWHESAAAVDAAASPMPPLAELRRRIDAELATGWTLYVAERGDRLAGMLAIKQAEAVLDQIFVSPDAQGKGIGRALLDCAKHEMPEGFTLRMAAANRRAERFYLRSGLLPVREGAHPVSGKPVRYFSWNGRTAPAPAPPLP